MGDSGGLYISSIGMGGTPAFVVFGVPSQDLSRQLFMVHNHRLYRVHFMPDDPQHSPVSYTQMENLYAMITNTFVFTK